MQLHTLSIRNYLTIRSKTSRRSASSRKTPNVLVVGASVPVASVGELIALAKAQPGKLTYASAGNGSSQHLAGALFVSMSKTDIVHVPYKGVAEGINGVLAGDVSMMFVPLANAATLLQSGKVKALGVTTPKRSPALSNVPTIAEAGVPGYEQTVWNALFAPAGTPPATVAKLNAAVRSAVASPDLKQKMEALGVEPAASTPEQMTAFLKVEIDKWGKVLRESGRRSTDAFVVDEVVTSMTTLVTGGCGFVGLAVAEALAARCERVVLLDRANPPAPVVAALAAMNSPAITATADVRDAAAIHASVAHHQPDCVIHLAAVTAHATQERSDPGSVVDVNVSGNDQRIGGGKSPWRSSRGLRRLGLRLWIDVVRKPTNFAEDISPSKPIGLYGITKLAAEQIALRLGQVWDLDVVAVRLEAFWAVGDRTGRAIASLRFAAPARLA